MISKEKLWWVNQYLLFGVLVILVLYFARVLLIPIVFGILLAMLMSPVCRYFDEKGFKRYLSALFSVLIIFAGFAAVISIISAQLSSLSGKLPVIEQKAEELLSSAQLYIHNNFIISPDKQIDFLKEQVGSLSTLLGGSLFDLMGIATTILAGLMLTLVYTYLFLYQKERYLKFVLKIYSHHDSKEVKSIITKISHISQLYLTGRAISVLILTILYSIGLLAVGLDNALLIACIAAILTIIPYVGTFIGGMLAFIMALVTEDSVNTALWVAVVITFIQTVDNYLIEPNIVGGEVNLNAFSTLFIIIAGGFIWGVPGMILFVPMLAVVKIIFDHVEVLKPYGYLIGNSGECGRLQSKIKLWIADGSLLIAEKLRFALKVQEKTLKKMKAEFLATYFWH